MSAAAFVVLTSPPAANALTGALVAQATDVLRDAGTDDARWLAPGEAWEMRLAGACVADGAALRDRCAAVMALVGSAPIDVNVVRSDPPFRRKRLLCADMESTIIREELIDEMAELMGRRREIAAITASAMAGDIAFAESLRRRVTALGGLALQQLDDIRKRISLMPGAETLVRTMAGHGATCALVSGGFTLFADEIGTRLGFDTVAANVLDIAEGRLSGRVREPVLGPSEKAQTLGRLAAQQGLGISHTIAVGDGANDVAMLEAAGLGVAFRAKPMLAARMASAENGVVITHGDLTALLYLQGYTRADFMV